MMQFNMMQFSPPSLETLAIARAALAALALIMALFALHTVRRLKAHNRSLESSLAEMRLALERAAGAGRRTARRSKRALRAATETSGRLGLLERRGESRSFDQAIDSARRGTAAGKLTEQFGLSRGEADLVSTLHGRKRAG